DAGYEEAMREAGLEPLPAVHVPGLHRVGRDPEPSFEARMTMTAGVLVPYLTGDTRIDAIMVHTDSAAMVAAEACRSFELRPHDDVAIVGYDDNWDADEIRRTMPRHAEGM